MTVLEFLQKQGGYYRPSEIADGTGIEIGVVTVRLRKLKEAGQVESRVYSPPKGKTTHLAPKPFHQYRAVAA